MSYPKPVRHVYVHEKTRAPWLNFHMPWKKKHEMVGTDCPDGQCVEDGGPVYSQAAAPSHVSSPASAPGYVMPPDLH
jgi:hypothetical protein